MDRLVAVARAGRLNTVPLGIVVMTVATTARITGDTAQLDEASDLFDYLHGEAQLSPLEEIDARLGLLMVAVAREDAVLARQQYARLLEIRVAGFEIWTLSCLTVSRVLGLLTHTIGELDKAAEHFEDALAFCRKGFRPELAWTCCDYADLLLERASTVTGGVGSRTAPTGDGERRKAVALLDESLALSSELGMRPLMERVLSRREILRA